MGPALSSRPTEFLCVGHPHGTIKKWSSGDVFKRQGNWFYATNFILPGNSGSPYLSDDGKIIGLVHRYEAGNRITRHDVLYQAIGTASSEFANALDGKDRTDLFFSVTAPHSEKEIADHQESYFMAHLSEATLEDGKKIDVLDVIGAKCDEALQKKDVRSPDEMERELGWCSKSWSWFNCRSKEDGAPYKTCPVGAAKEKWRQRYLAAAKEMQSYNNVNAYAWLFSPLYLEETQEGAVATKRRFLREEEERFKPALSFELAYHFADAYGKSAQYSRRSIVDFIEKYREQPKYEFQYEWIIAGFQELLESDALSKKAFAHAIDEMFQDEKLDLLNKLSLESTAYQMGLLCSWKNASPGLRPHPIHDSGRTEEIEDTKVICGLRSTKCSEAKTLR